MAEPTRILFVDDEPGIRATLPAILGQFGFQVIAAATVPEALHLVSTRQFDVLIADLNVGQPGDGFTVVSAMRRTQPNAITFILTGYPAFETALEAIRQQVDDYLIKPADVQGMVERIKLKLSTPTPAVHHIEARRLSEILQQNKHEIVERWLSAAKQDPQIMSVRLSDRELTEYLPSAIEEAIHATGKQKLSQEGVNTAAVHGRTRFKQGWTIPTLMRESRILQQALSRFIQENLLGVDISSVIPAVMQIGEAIQAYFEASVREYIHARHAASEAAQNKGKPLLLLSGDRELSLLRMHVLKHAGYSVTRADSRREALRLLHDTFDALVISDSMSGESILEMTELFRRQNPHSAVITIAKGQWQNLKVDTDFAISGGDGPEALIEAVESALNRGRLRRIK